ncbi:MAG TPA: c-type cytochrome, partial [Rhizobiales bacterium]|nr:c-type cytochrome [Hyphomicrobiales bacterium]
MRKLLRGLMWLGALAFAGFGILYWMVLPLLGAAQSPPDLDHLKGDARRGAYIATAAGCYACHTDVKKGGKPYAGKHALKTPFGTFYTPNITPDPQTGIGGWSVTDLTRALTAGVSPAGEHYFPSFPYTSYTGMRAQDIADLKAYLDTLTPVVHANRAHDVRWPFSDRRFLGAWKALFFTQQKLVSGSSDELDPARRGAYLANVLGHCGECHTQRNVLGGMTGKKLAGNTRGPDGGKVPGITAMDKRNTPWSRQDVLMSLQMGMPPDGDFVGGSMAKVVDHTPSKLKPEDL